MTMWKSGPLLATLDERGVMRATFNRPNVSNAFDGEMLRRFDSLLHTCNTDPAVRVLYLSALGRNFCSGVDLKWLASRQGADDGETFPSLEDLLAKLHGLGKPIVTRVQGAAVGAGAVIVACSDLAVAASDTYFALPEVRLGIPPLPLLPYVTAAIGARWTARYVLTGDRLSTDHALQIGLIHAAAPLEESTSTAEVFVDALLRGGPGALSRVKKALAILGQGPREGLDDGRDAAETPEATEGIAAFLEKRSPSWYRT